MNEDSRWIEERILKQEFNEYNTGSSSYSFTAELALWFVLELVSGSLQTQHYTVREKCMHCVTVRARFGTSRLRTFSLSHPRMPCLSTVYTTDTSGPTSRRVQINENIHVISVFSWKKWTRGSVVG